MLLARTSRTSVLSLRLAREARKLVLPLVQVLLQRFHCHSGNRTVSAQLIYYTGFEGCYNQQFRNPTQGRKMKFFLDTANLDELKAGSRWGIIDGVTTNPSLIAKEGVALEEQIRRICDIIEGDVSAEVVATEADEMRAPG